MTRVSAPQGELYWDDWSKMGIFKAPKAGSQSGELMVGGLTGVMDLKIFYRGKNRGEGGEGPPAGRGGRRGGQFGLRALPL